MVDRKLCSSEVVNYMACDKLCTCTARVVGATKADADELGFADPSV